MLLIQRMWQKCLKAWKQKPANYDIRLEEELLLNDFDRIYARTCD